MPFRHLWGPVVLSAGLTLGALPAQAAPTPVTPPPSALHVPVDAPRDDRDLTKGEKRDLAAVVSIESQAISQSRASLNYAKANQYDKGNTVARRQFAAGWLSLHKSITHISKAELAEVKKVLRTKISPAGVSPCTGVTKVVTRYKKSAFWDRFYLDSCDTNDLIAACGTIALVAGVAAGILPASFPVAVAVSAIFGAGAIYLQYEANRSDLTAVIVNDHFHLITVQPQ